MTGGWPGSGAGPRPSAGWGLPWRHYADAAWGLRGERTMSDVLDRIRRELQQRLEATRAAAQEHECVRAALEALEQATRPFEKATRRAAGEASRRGRSLAARARPASARDGSATSGANAGPRSSGARANAPERSPRARDRIRDARTSLGCAIDESQGRAARLEAAVTSACGRTARSPACGAGRQP